MTPRNATRAVWMLIAAIVAAFFLFLLFTNQTPGPRPQGEFPSEQAPATT